MKQQLFTTDDAVSTACAVNTKRRGRLLAMAAGILSVLILLVTAMQFVISAGADRYSEYSNSCRKYMMAFMKNDSTYSQLVNATRLPYRNYVESLQRDQGFLNSLTAWKAANLDLSGGVSEITQSAEYKYYLGILMDLMTDTVNETDLLDAANAYMDALHISLAKQSVNTLKKYNELSMKVDKEDSETLLNEIGMLEEASDVLDLIGDIGNVIEKANNLGDLIDKISQLCAIHDLTKGYSEVMRFMCDACDSDNIALKSALAYMRDVTSGALTEEMASAILTGQTVADDALKSVLGAVKKSVLSVMGYGGTVISFAQSLSKYVANQLFATDNIQSAFYKSRALYDIEDLLRLALKGTSSADRFFAAFSLYENVMYKGADYSVSYYKAVYEDSIFGKVFAWIQGNGDAASKFKSMMSDEKDRLKVSFDNLQRRAYNGYKCLAHTSEVGDLNVRQEYIIPDLSDLVENDAQLNKLSIETYGLPDEDYTLTEDMTLYANVYHSNGTIDLNGHSLTILGDLVLEGGCVKINGGQLNISGDYNAAIPVTNSDGTTGYNGGYLDMGNINDKVTVSGDFNTCYDYDGAWHNYLKLGTIETKGNLNDYYCCGNGNHTDWGIYSDGTKFIFSGSGEQTVTASDGYICFENVDFQNPNITFIETEISCYIEKDETVNGDLYISEIDLKGHKLTVNGNLQLRNKITLNGGELYIAGDYNAAIPVTNSDGTTGYTGGYLDMGNVNDKVTVDGDFNTYRDNDNLHFGTIEIKGNLNDYYCYGNNNYTYNGLYSDGTKFIFSGKGKQTINATDGYIYFQKVDFVDTKNREIVVNCEINIELCGDAYITGDNATVRGNLNGYALNVSKNLTVNDTLDIQGGCLNVKGNLYNYGAVNLGSGSLIVNGNYNAYKSATDTDGTVTYSNGGYLHMGNINDKVTVDGDFNTCCDYSNHSHYLNKGTIVINGNLIDYYNDSSNYGLYSNGTKFIFSGAGKQTITATDGYIRFSDVDFVDTENRELVINCEISADLCSDTYITGDATVCGNLNGHLLNVSGNLTVNNSIDVAGGDIVVEGDLYNYGSISLNGGYLTVNGNYNAYKSTTNKDGTITYSEGGYLDTDSAVDKVIVSGDFNTCFNYYYSGTLCYGTIEIKGDLNDYFNNGSTNSDGVYSNGTKFIFNGTGTQIITALDGKLVLNTAEFVNKDVQIDCSTDIDVDVPVRVHDYSDEWTVDVEAACNDGSKSHHCTRCDAKTDITVIPGKGHKVVIDAAVAPSCTEPGLTEGSHCSVCNTVIKAQETVPATGHDFENGICKNCNMDEAMTIQSKHPYDNSCDETWTIHRDGATRIDVTFTDETYTESGYDYIYIYDGDDKLIGKYSGSELSGKTISVNSDTVKIRLTSDSSNTQYGFALDKVEYSMEAQCAHSNTEIRNAKSAGCMTEGYTGDTYCKDCGEKISSGEVIPAKGHTEVTDKAVAATCTKTGLTEGKHCSVCDAVIKAQEVVPAKGHTEVTDKAVAATCTKTGLTEGIHCSVCNAVIKAQETVPATGKHSFGNWKITKAATCTADGTQTRTCSVCGKVETQTIVALGHTEVVDKAVEATCTKTGLTEGKHCSVCDAVIKAQEVVPAKGHKYVDTVVKPTYTAQGYTLHKCSVCGTSYKDTYTAKLTLAKVTGVKLGGRAADALRVNWTKNANASGYIVEMYQGNKWVRVAKITSNATTTYRASGLKASSVYKFRVRAYKMEGKAVAYGAYSTELAARTNPSVMTGAKLSGRAADALRINWIKNASADGYIVEMYQGNKWVRVAKITNNSTTTFRKAGLKASTVYKFRVRAYNMSGKTALYGNYSATVTARTNPSIVKGVKIGGKAKDALRVNWIKNSSAQGYIVEMYKGGKWVRVAKITNSNTTTFRKAGLAKNTTYKFRVKAYYMSGKTALYGNYGSVSGKTAAK